jgi:RimJ/RimL family protein N-acetyltransferase
VLGGIVRGKLTTLRTPKESDLAKVNAWMADLQVRRGGHLWDEPAWIDTWKERYKEIAKAERQVLWAIEAEGRAVGLIAVEVWPDPLGGVDLRFFFLDPEVWRRGFGWDAALALHRYLLDYLDLKVVTVSVPADNAGALRIAERLGYREFGRGHEVYYRDAAYVDRVELRFDRATWNERFGESEREYAPLGAEVQR